MWVDKDGGGRMTEVQRLAKIMVLKDMLKEYELLAKYNGGTDYDRWKALDMAIKALEQAPKWIPVSERLPEENKTVIASTKYGVYPEARYTKEDGWEWAYESGADYWVDLDEVEAWMPLPEPYKAESEVQDD